MHINMLHAYTSPLYLLFMNVTYLNVYELCWIYNVIYIYFIDIYNIFFFFSLYEHAVIMVIMQDHFNMIVKSGSALSIPDFRGFLSFLGFLI